MQALTILYDPECGLCRKLRAWLECQPAYLRLSFLPAGTEAAAAEFPGLDPQATLRDLTVVSDDGRVYRGEAAYLMCLYALKGYREWSLALAGPVGRVLFRLAVSVIERVRWRASCEGGCPIRSGRVEVA